MFTQLESIYQRILRKLVRFGVINHVNAIFTYLGLNCNCDTLQKKSSTFSIVDLFSNVSTILNQFYNKNINNILNNTIRNVVNNTFLTLQREIKKQEFSFHIVKIYTISKKKRLGKSYR